MPIPVAIEEYLTREGCPYTPVHHRRAYTAQEEAAVTHTPGHEWAKTVVCFCDGKPVLVVLGADRRVDLERLRRVSGAAAVRMASEPEFARLYGECEIGAMPPLGPLFGQRVFVDRRLAQCDEITFNAGTHTDGVRMPYRAFAEMVEPIVGDFTWHI
jgi:Ala-tRNA(Pro) deacylase